MKLVRFELKKLFRFAGFRYLCAALLAFTFLSALFASPYLPEDEDYIAKYEDNISYVIRVAKRNLLEYEAVSDGDHYMMRYQRDVIERYSSLLNDGVKPTEIRGWNEFFNNNVDELLALIGAILAGVLLSLAEFDNGTEKILHITRNGRKSVLSKISVLALFSFAEIILMTAASLVGTALHFGLSSPSAYLCSVEIFTYCPYGFTIGRYIVLSVLIKAAELFLISVLAALAAVLTRSYLASIVLPSALICGGYMISKGGNANLPDIYSIVLTSPIFVRYRSLNVFDKSIPIAVSSVFMLTLIGAASAVLFYFLFLKVIGGSRISDLERSIVKLIVKAKDHLLSILPKKKARRRGLLFSEAKKSFIKSHLIFLCAVMIIIKIGSFAETMKNNNPAEEFYRDICYSMSGELTDEKRALVSDKLAECNAVISRFNSMRDAVVSGMITNDEYQTYLDEHSRASAERYVYTKLALQIARIDAAAERGISAKIIYDTGWIAFFEQGHDIILYIFLLLFFSGIYENEYKTGFFRIASVSASGMEALHKSKIELALIVSAFVFLLFSLTDLIALTITYPLSNISFSLASVVETEFAIPIWLGMTVKYAVRMALSILFGISVCLLSRFLKKIYLVIPAGILIAIFII